MTEGTSVEKTGDYWTVCGLLIGGLPRVLQASGSKLDVVTETLRMTPAGDDRGGPELCHGWAEFQKLAIEFLQRSSCGLAGWWDEVIESTENGKPPDLHVIECGLK